MSTIQPGSRTQATHRDQTSTVSAIWSSIASAWRCIAQRRAQALRNRRDMEVLSQLDDRQLNDIGLLRSQIESFVADRPRQGAATSHVASTRRLCDAPA
jgi:uncharacterized protein YjiS (DUF1127 family)